jgi:hypothetical protein
MVAECPHTIRAELVRHQQQQVGLVDHSPKHASPLVSGSVGGLLGASYLYARPMPLDEVEQQLFPD